MSTELRRLEAILRGNFCAFVQKSFSTLCPGQDYVRSWHIEAMAYELDRVRQGESLRLITSMPPRSLKSIVASVAFPAFVLGRDPSRRIICVSYSADLAKKHSNDFRALIESAWYRALFPHTRIGPYKNSETEIELTERGFRLATSVGGTLTGRGGDLIVIDDPLKPDDAHSETRRNAANEWYNNTLLSRLDDKRTGAIVLVAQRLHMDDLIGFVTSRSNDWMVLNLPAIAESDEEVQISPTTFHNRKAGEPLSPKREPLPVLEALKLQLGSDAFSAQYQQAPAPPGGAMIKRDWIRRYAALPPSAESLFAIQSWDTASKGGPENDFSVCTTWQVTRDRRWFLLDVWRKRVDFPSLKAAVITLAARWKPSRVLVEDAASGTALFQDLRGKVPGILAIRPEHDKVVRMSHASTKFEAGLVFLPERASWLADFETELFAFPGVKYDDQCDSVSQALIDGTKSCPMIITDELLAASRMPGPYTWRNMSRFG